MASHSLYVLFGDVSGVKIYKEIRTSAGRRTSSGCAKPQIEPSVKPVDTSNLLFANTTKETNAGRSELVQTCS